MTTLTLIAAALLLIGAWTYRRITGTEAFAVAGRSAPAWLVTGSLMATVVGGSSTIGMAGLGFEKGLVGAWWLLSGVVGLLVLAFALADRVRSAEVYTLPELLGKQYGETVKMCAAVVIAIAWLGIIAGQMVAAGKIMSVLSPWPVTTWIAVGGVVFLAYAFLGGQHSILRTDALQCVLLVGGVLLCAAVGLRHVGGWGALVESLPNRHLGFPAGEPADWPFIVRMLVLVGATYLVGPDVYSRLFCARDGRAARTATAATALCLLPMAFAVVTIGLVAKVSFPDLAAEQALPTVASELLPGWLTVSVVAGLLAAVMSSADTCLVTAGVIVGLDVIRDRFVRGLDEPAQLRLCRLCVLVIGGLSLAVALWVQSVVGALLLGYTVYTAGLVLPTLAGFWRERLRVNEYGAVASVLVGGGLALSAKLGGPANLDLIAVGASGVALFAVSWAAGNRPQAAKGQPTLPS